MNWREVPLTEHMTEAAAVVGEAEVVIEFAPAARGWFRVSVFEDLKEPRGDRFFARAVEKEDPQVQATASAETAEDAAARCLLEAGISLRRARGR